MLLLCGVFVMAQNTFTCGTSKIKDYEGNDYNTVQIGNQCWMKENLRTTKYQDGTSIASGGTNQSNDIAYYYYPNNDINNVDNYGLLYNWKAVMNNSASNNDNPSIVQGICLDGWHVPSNMEWSQLTSYISSQEIYRCNNGNSDIAKSIASTEGWQSSTNNCAVGRVPEKNNTICFSALPAGYLYNSTYGDFGKYVFFWSCTQQSNNSAYRRNLYFDNSIVGIGYSQKVNGYSVRCLRNL